jgi:hypothetical protein
MPRPTLNDIRSAGQLSHAYDWFVVFNLAGAGTDLKKLASNLGVTDNTLNIRCESSDQPKRTNDKVTIDNRGHQVFYPGRTTYSNTLTLTFLEYVDMNVITFINAWFDLLWSPGVGAQSNKNDLSATVELHRVAPDSTTETFAYQLNGCFPSDFDSGGNMDGSTSAPFKPTLTLSYDYYVTATKGGTFPTIP